MAVRHSWAVVTRPKCAKSERLLNLAWKFKKPRPIHRPVIPFITNGDRKFDLTNVYEAIVAAELADDVRSLPPRYHKRLNRYALAGLQVVEEYKYADKRFFIRSPTGDRVAAVVRSLPAVVRKPIYKRVAKNMQQELRAR